jgi:subtilase family serine protease
MKKRNEICTIPSFKQLLLSSILLAAFSAEAHALPGDLIKATPPYRLKSTRGTASNVGGLTPAQVITAYNFSSIPAQGEGQVIAIVDAYDDPNAEADLATFNTSFNLPACTTANGCFQKLYGNGIKPAGDPGWGVEISLDIQWAHAIAPKAKIILVEATTNSFSDLFQAINVGIKNGATVVSLSWGSNEFTGENTYDSVFNRPLVTFTAASGDNGHGVWYPAASPYVIGVGGTTLSVNSTGNYLSEKAWGGSGGGISTVETEPSYQLNFPIPNNPSKFRGEPDVAYNADPNTGFAIYDSYGQGGWLVIGGTSAGSPQWAALIAIAQSSVPSLMVGINSTLYNIAKNSLSTTFHDITTGSNGNCGTLCNAVPGYDYVTGLGTPQAAALIAAITGTTPPPPPPPPPSQDPAKQLENDFHKTRLGKYATCTATATLVTCIVPGSTVLISNTLPDSTLNTLVAKSVTTMQTDVIAINPTAYAKLTCQLQPNSMQIINYNATSKYAVFNGLCTDPLPFPT